MINRDGQLVQVRGNTRLQAGDVVLILGEPDTDLDQLFTATDTGATGTIN